MMVEEIIHCFCASDASKLAAFFEPLEESNLESKEVRHQSRPRPMILRRLQGGGECFHYRSQDDKRNYVEMVYKIVLFRTCQCYCPTAVDSAV